MQPGLEVAPASENDKRYIDQVDEGNKEVVRPDNVVFHHPAQGYTPEGFSDDRLEPRTICGLRRRLIWGLLATAVLVLALGLGLGVGLGVETSNESFSTGSTNVTSGGALPTLTSRIADTAKIGGVLDESYTSDSGAWNGSGVAQTYQTFATTLDGAPEEHSTVIYYQHHTGEIRWLRLTVDGKWLRGPPDTEVIAKDAKNSTAIAAMHYDMNEISNWHVFCKFAPDLLLI